MSNNNNLGNSRERKYDEFYTQLSDIEAELCHYKNHFKGKTVFCNCDDPYESNFFKYFALNFKALGLKKLITTGYYTSPIAGKELKLFEDEKDVPVNQPYVVYINNTDDITEEMQIHRIADVATLLKNKHNTRRKLYGDNKYPAGDFRSEESVALLKQADIVVTNPPFSLFREFVAQLVECGKKFLIIGNKNAITYKNFFPLIKDNKVWIGFYSPAKFNVGYSCELKNMTGLCRWFTNLSLKKQSDQMVLWQRYYDDNGSPLPDIEKKYPKYDNYDAINVDKVQDIPCDYFGVMGVPITFLDKYNPSVLGDDMLSTGGGTEASKLFRIIGIDRYTIPQQYLVGGRAAVNGKPKYARMLIERRDCKIF